MTSEIRLAFAHPSARSEALSDEPRDRISLRDHTREVEIGAFQAERGVVQRICFNIVVETRLSDDGLDDDVDKILSYDSITEAIDRELSAERLNLLETLAERVAEAILTDPRAGRVFVRIEKLDRGPGALGVEIVRDRAQITPAVEIAPRPCVVHLDNSVIASAQLGAVLDRLAAQEMPLILTTAHPQVTSVMAAHPSAQRRIDLLALEQNAWVLAGHDKRCVVVSTRTELDWAMKHGQISVWAPSKIVLDATDPPETEPRDTGALARWFASEFDAQSVFAIGDGSYGITSIRAADLVRGADLPTS